MEYYRYIPLINPNQSYGFKEPTKFLPVTSQSPIPATTAAKIAALWIAACTERVESLLLGSVIPNPKWEKDT